MFQKSKSKLDSKVRFQQNTFRKQLQNAREYKRNSRHVPKTDWEIFFAKIGLGTWLRKILFFAGIILSIYIIFIPNFLYVKSITINGLAPQAQEEARQLAMRYMAQQPLAVQHNIIFLSKKKLGDYLLQNFSEILSVEAIKKSFPHSIIINVRSRVNEFLVSADTSRCIATADGMVSQKLPDGTAVPPQFSGLAKISFTRSVVPAVGSRVLDLDTIGKLQNIKNGFLHVLNLPIEHFSLETPTSTDVTIVTQAGYKIYISLLLEIPKTIDQISLVLQNTDGSQKNNLSYIDMRYKDRGFACFKNSPCAADKRAMNASTTTPAALGTATSTHP